jgi:hypothetical protein
MVSSAWHAQITVFWPAFLYCVPTPPQRSNMSAGHYPIGNVSKGLLHLVDENEA